MSERVPETAPLGRLNAPDTFLIAINTETALTDETVCAPVFVATELGNPEFGNIHLGKVRVCGAILASAPTFAILCSHMLRS